MENLRKHRLYRHNELTYGSGDAPLLTQISQKDLTNTASSSAVVNEPVVKTNSLPHSSSGEWRRAVSWWGRGAEIPEENSTNLGFAPWFSNLSFILYHIYTSTCIFRTKVSP